MTECEFKSIFTEYSDKQSKVFVDSLAQQSDRAFAIIALCWLDNLLEKLLRRCFIKDPKVKDLFNDDNLLRTYYSKVNMAYFLGLIPKFIFHDLKLLGEIRNRFAHELVAELTFEDDIIMQRINRCLLNPSSIDEVGTCLRPNSLKFTAIVTAVGHFIMQSEFLLMSSNLPHIVEIFKLDELAYDKILLPKSKVRKIIKNCRTCSIGKLK